MSEVEPTHEPDTDELDIEEPETAGQRNARYVRIALRTVIQIAVAIAIVFGGMQLAKKFKESGPEGPSWGGGGPPRNAMFVETLEVAATSEPIVIEASGTVVPAREIGLHPQVAGEIEMLSPSLEPGGLVAAGELLVELDDAEYRIAEDQAEAQRDIAEASRRLEEANQEVARAEYELFGSSLDDRAEDLMLREPQLAQAEASLESAEAALDRAQLDRRRTRIEAPFDAFVDSRTADVGSRVTPGSQIAWLIGTDRFWIEVSIPVDALRWIDVPGRDGTEGSVAHVYHDVAWGPDVYREARVVRLDPALEDGGRLARVLVEVEDPMALQPENADLPELFLNAWVRVEIVGESIDNTIAINRDHLRNGHEVWVLTADDTLDIREVEILFRRIDDVLVGDGLATGDQVITSELQAPVDGMTLRTRPPEGEGGPPGGRPGGPPGATGRPSQ